MSHTMSIEPLAMPIEPLAMSIATLLIEKKLIPRDE
jgi:hypothetical protein